MESWQVERGKKMIWQNQKPQAITLTVMVHADQTKVAFTLPPGATATIEAGGDVSVTIDNTDPGYAGITGASP